MTFKNDQTKKEFERNKRAFKKEFSGVSFIGGAENKKVVFVGFDRMLRETETTPLLLFASDPANNLTFCRYTAEFVRTLIKKGACI